MVLVLRNLVLVSSLWSSLGLGIEEPGLVLEILVLFSLLDVRIYLLTSLHDLGFEEPGFGLESMVFSWS